MGKRGPQRAAKHAATVSRCSATRAHKGWNKALVALGPLKTNHRSSLHKTLTKCQFFKTQFTTKLPLFCLFRSPLQKFPCLTLRLYTHMDGVHMCVWWCVCVGGLTETGYFQAKGTERYPSPLKVLFHKLRSFRPQNFNYTH